MLGSEKIGEDAGLWIVVVEEEDEVPEAHEDIRTLGCLRQSAIRPMDVANDVDAALLSNSSFNDHAIFFHARTCRRRSRAICRWARWLLPRARGSYADPRRVGSARR